jgi:hypothetical protein
MRNLKTAFALTAAAFVLAACTDRPDSAPTAPVAPAPVNLEVGTAATFTTLACDFTLLKSDARDYASSGNDLLFTIISDLQKAKQKSTPAAVAAANDKVFDGLARMAAIRGTSAQKSGVANQGEVFDNLVHRFFGCASANISANAAEQDFAGALGAQPWMFEVRGKNIGDAVYDDPTGVAYERGAPAAAWWAVENAGASWNASITTSALAKRVLVYGYRTDYFGNPSGKLGASFDTYTIPHIQSSAPAFGLAVKVGLCVFDTSDPLTPVTPTQRVNHDGTFLPNVSMTCGASAPAYNVASASSPLSSFAQYAMSLITPKSAHAAAMFFGGSIGAAPSELSPSAVYDLGVTRLSFNGTIADTRINTQLQTTGGAVLAVQALDADGVTPLPDVIVRLEIAGNESAIAFFRDGNQNKVFVDRETGADGYARFTGVAVSKPGGHTLSAKVNVAEVVGTPKLSNQFNVKNNK